MPIQSIRFDPPGPGLRRPPCRPRSFPLAAALAGVLVAGPAAAGDAPPDSSRVRTSSGLCFRGGDCSRCQSIFLLELTFASSGERCGKGPFTQGEIGLLVNVSPDYGIGGSFFYGGDDCGGRVGFRARIRRWIAPMLGLDLGPGIVFGDDQDFSGARYPSFSGQIALDVAGLIGPVYQVELHRYRSRTQWDSFIGIRTESYAAPLLGLLLVIAVGATYSST